MRVGVAGIFGIAPRRCVMVSPLRKMDQSKHKRNATCGTPYSARLGVVCSEVVKARFYVLLFGVCRAAFQLWETSF